MNYPFCDCNSMMVSGNYTLHIHFFFLSDSMSAHNKVYGVIKFCCSRLVLSSHSNLLQRLIFHFI